MLPDAGIELLAHVSLADRLSGRRTRFWKGYPLGTAEASVSLEQVKDIPVGLVKRFHGV
ncbi:hypothetical protein [Curtobacterium sp. VKM Ac-2852]|uniref:hypothetical protein n=1 Tax=Curtobacterium sp. VKM Ac-2852 TaxID=2739024 RepID=UPI0015671F58|nr:hypothetical protein [Curtobacterium sp. VKM Ac-2852]NQX22667.1 hypothetical protein [Curtobacterium sp. VKM Ac-2852]